MGSTDLIRNGSMMVLNSMAQLVGERIKNPAGKSPFQGSAPADESVLLGTWSPPKLHSPGIEQLGQGI
jgi:hypothetical protein